MSASADGSKILETRLRHLERPQDIVSLQHQTLEIWSQRTLQGVPSAQGPGWG